MAEFYRGRGCPDRAISIYKAILGEGHLPTLHRLEIGKALGDTFIEAEHPREALESYEGLRKTLEETAEGRQLASDPSLMGPIYEGLADAQVREGLHEAATISYERALHLCNMDRVKCGTYNQLVLLNNLASCHLALGKEGSVNKSREVAQLALDIMKRGEVGDGDQDMIAKIKQNLSEILWPTSKS